MSLDRLGASTPRLVGCVLLAIAVGVLGNVLSPWDWLRAVWSLLGAAILALAIASWQINERERKRRSAMQGYWQPFSSNMLIVLPIRAAEQEADENELSPFTPFHDARAGHKIQHYLQRTYRREVPIVSAAELTDLDALGTRNVVLVGGPNLNHITDKLMKRVWDQHKGRFFHWSSTLEADPEVQSIVTTRDDHLLQIHFEDGHPEVGDRIEDMHNGPDGRLLEARGMCLRLDGPLARGRHVLVVAGVDTAYGTLAAAEFALDPDNVVPLSSGDSQVIVSARPNRNGVDAPRSVRSIDGHG